MSVVNIIGYRAALENPLICMVDYWRYYKVDEICECNSCMDEHGVSE
tara:strand:+ start:151 stop:291 length:141 start_codon:yes stop_codon:yes gene_type:complete